MAFDMVHLRDQHDARAEQRHADEDRRVRKRGMSPVEEDAGHAIGAEETAEDERETEETRHLAPVRRDEAHGTESDEHGAENAEHRRQLHLARLRSDIAADRGLTVGRHPTRLAPARKIAVETAGITRHGRSIKTAAGAAAGRISEAAP